MKIVITTLALTAAVLFFGSNAQAQNGGNTVAAPSTPTGKVLEYKDLKGNHNVSVKDGDAISVQMEWKRDPGLFCPPEGWSFAIKSTDGKTGSVIEGDTSLHARPAGKDKLEVLRWKAVRPGTAQITITNLNNNKVITTITVTVK
jgi:hypothetical protein